MRNLSDPSILRRDEEKAYYSLTRKVFDALAPFYDIVTSPISGVRDKVVAFARAEKGVKVLDVATGTGKQAFAFAQRGYDVIGIDLTEAMLRVATKKNKYKNLKFQMADATKLPFEDGAFDVVSISFALHDMPLTIREKVLMEMLRVTKPTGMIVIVDYALPKNRIGRFLIYRFVRLYEGEYYQQFIESDFMGLLKEAKIEIKEELPALFGAVRILKGAKVMTAAPV
jgi:demethylmenaquinone methyltransferase/2-methoxy-6-polyprenyl-1,4-benzoquinol methylase